MTVTINGTTGIDKVQDAVVQNATLAAGVPSTAKLPAGTVLQVVNTVVDGSNGAVNSTSTTWSDVFSSSITPISASSKILVIAAVNGISNYGGTTTGQIQLLRDGSVLKGVDGYIFLDSSASAIGGVSINYLDSPATTSSITYKIQMRRLTGTGTFQVTNYSTATTYTTSTITLMEIAA